MNAEDGEEAARMARALCRQGLEDGLAHFRARKDRRPLVQAVRSALEQCVGTSSNLANEVLEALGHDRLTLSDLYLEAEHWLGALLLDPAYAEIVNERPEDPNDPEEFGERIARRIQDGSFDPRRIGIDPLDEDGSPKPSEQLVMDIIAANDAWTAEPGPRGWWTSRRLKRGVQTIVMEACAKRWSEHTGDITYSGESFRKAFAAWEKSSSTDGGLSRKKPR